MADMQTSRTAGQLLLLIIIGCVVAACSSSNQVFEQQPRVSERNGTLYLYRPAAENPGIKPKRMSWPEVEIDGRSMGSLKYNQYFSIELPAGKHLIRITGLTHGAKNWEFRDIERSITIGAGENSFMKLLVAFDLDQMALMMPNQYIVRLHNVSQVDAPYEIRYTEHAGHKQFSP
jgi:hypothetical protein